MVHIQDLKLVSKVTDQEFKQWLKDFIASGGCVPDPGKPLAFIDYNITSWTTEDAKSALNDLGREL